MAKKHKQSSNKQVYSDGPVKSCGSQPNASGSLKASQKDRASNSPRSLVSRYPWESVSEDCDCLCEEAERVPAVEARPILANAAPLRGRRRGAFYDLRDGNGDVAVEVEVEAAEAPREG